MRSVQLIGLATLLSNVIGGGVLAADAPSHAEETGWEKIIVVPADPLMVNTVPSPAQLRYQTAQMGAFCHFGPARFLNHKGTYEDMEATPDPKVFNPDQLDAEQWVRVAKSFDAKHIVFTAKHINGFCNWPTKTTDYSVRSSPWKNGRGDVVREVADACKKHGIGLGLYISGNDHHFPCYKTEDGKKLVGDIDAYWPVYRRQVEELLTNYGELVCLWMDHYGCPFSWSVPTKLVNNPKTGKPYLDEIVAMARAKQPNIVLWSGSKPDFHFCANELGTAPYPLWNVIHKGEGRKFDMTWAEGWVIRETYNCQHFVWGGVSTPSTPEEYMRQYYLSIGHGANVLEGMFPDTHGLIDDVQAKCWADFGAEVRRRFDHPIARTDSSKGWLEPGVLEIDLGGAKKITHVVMEEELAKGQHVLKYAIDALSNGNWKTVAEGQSIGRKRIERLNPAIATERVRFRVVQANAIPSISAVMVYDK
jgi:alpha-L-fucosidase